MENSLNLPKEDNVEESEIINKNNVTLFNDSNHTFDQVTNQLMIAIHCDEKSAFKLAFLIDRNGSAVVFSGSIEECIIVSSILESIGLKTSISV